MRDASILSAGAVLLAHAVCVAPLLLHYLPRWCVVLTASTRSGVRVSDQWEAI
jgi:hypothetical protein